ncbi:MAG: MurR/RpiR family transcriptional regulator [Roseovarius sp.]|uniref:MurR/RpiR family transcriptional regulator n=1 Tax=Roseovarius sp. TaxID=1486281 RepID=UPI001B77E99F|nr:MurR/RpiR family transcriptional regulator [Roseovarius sp.]MBQ0751747.1 MurR/RpiR family transcriptional regulator [Roseovarius sp.]MBQ0809468.1 MurR/RpiR family transcriptional regulator [Roseovarius sp.]
MYDKEVHLRGEIAKLAQDGPRKLAAFARWILDNFDQVAFQSIRNLAEAASVDSNLVTRLSHSLGFDGFNDFRDAVREIVQHRGKTYGGRARALSGRDGTGIYAEMIAASQRNLDAVTTPLNIADIDSCVEILLQARRIHTVGVRSCFSVAHYFSYVGSMAFDNFVEVPSMPGAILDQISWVTPEDVLVAIAYEHYSAEVVRACQVARDRGAKIIALTDADSSPIALGAEKSIFLPMSGPQLMPSLVSALLTVEMILAALASRRVGVAERIEEFEKHISIFGGYLRVTPR